MTDNPPTIGEPDGTNGTKGWLMRPKIRFNDSYSWLVFGPLQVIWNIPDRRPIVHWTKPYKPFLFG